MNGFILTITNLIMRSMGMVFNLYVSNKIGSEAVGLFSLVMSVYLFAVTLATSGLNLACTNLVSEQFTKGNFLDGLKAVKSCHLFALFLGITSSCVVLIFSNTIAKVWLQNRISPTPLYLIALGLPFIASSSVMNGYFAAVRKAYKSAISQFFEVSIKMMVSIVLLRLVSLKSVEMVCICLLLADVISEIFSCLFLWILYQFDKRQYSKRKVTSITFKKRILKITFPVSITSYIRSGLSTVKQFMVPNRLIVYGLPYSLALSEYGKITGMAFPVITFPNLFISSFSSLLIPEFASLWAGGNEKRIVTICRKILGITTFFCIPVISILMIFSNELSLAIFQNLECAKYIKILSPLILFMCLDNIIDNMLKGLNKQFKVMLYNIIDLGITICLLYFFIPIWGMNGFILTIYISEIFNFSISFYELYQVTGFRFFR